MALTLTFHSDEGPKLETPVISLYYFYNTQVQVQVQVQFFHTIFIYLHCRI